MSPEKPKLSAKAVFHRIWAFRERQLPREWLLLIFWSYILWCELILRQNSVNSFEFFWTVGLLPTFLFSGVAALLLYALCSVFSPRVNRIMEQIFFYGLMIFYVSQLIYFHQFHFYYSAYSVGNGGQILEFWRVVLHIIGVQCIRLLLIVLPAVLVSLFGKVFTTPRLKCLRHKLGIGLCGLALHFLTVIALPLLGTGPMSPFDLYNETVNLKMGALQLGLLPSFRLDIHRLIFGFEGGTLVPETDLIEIIDSTPEETVTTEALPTETTVEETIPQYVTDPKLYNVLEIDFDALLEGEENETVRALHEYFRDRKPTMKNEMTGLFEGCNLIQITAEGFSYLAIDPELTPTLYMLQTQGIQFNNFYTAYWDVSTSDGEYVNLTGTLPKSGVWSMYNTTDNAMPLTMVQQLKRLGYSAYAFHNHSADYYHRDQSHPSLGYVYKAVERGLEITKQWPESDLELIDVSTSDYMNAEPFHAYYMTVSGHLPYSFDIEDNAMAAKNQELVQELPYSEEVRAYLACQIELDRALELLLQRLDEAGVAENTVIVLSADHYPYGLPLEAQSELAGHMLDTKFEIYRNACLIYKKGMEPMVVDRPCSSLDLLPTLSNLFGLEFDSRLYMGQDIFSDAEPLLIFSDRSWMTDQFAYYTLGEDITLFDESIELTQEQIEAYNDIVSNKFLVSQWVLEEDYWRILFGDNLPPDDLPSEEETDETESTEASSALPTE